VRPILGDRCLVGKGPEGSRQPARGNLNRRHAASLSEVVAVGQPVTYDPRSPTTTASAHRRPAVPDATRTSTASTEDEPCYQQWQADPAAPARTSAGYRLPLPRAQANPCPATLTATPAPRFGPSGVPGGGQGVGVGTTPTVDREQLTAPGMLRQRFGNVQILAVIDQPATRADGPSRSP
jgi:hypothetical protein